MSESLIFVNPSSRYSKGVVKYFDSKKLQYCFIKNINDTKKILTLKINKGIKRFIICGGDGTINAIVNILMKLPKNERKSVKLGIIPSGRANDLANHLKIPKEVDKALEKSKRGGIKKLDIIKVNGHYFLTGGGIGLPAKVIKETLSQSSKNQIISKILGRRIYSYHVFRELTKGCEGITNVRLNNNKLDGNFMAICILNQPFIGKKFKLSQKSKNNDGFIELCFVNKSPSKNGDIETVRKISRGEVSSLKNVKVLKIKKTNLNFKRSQDFMGDGEILCRSKNFSIELKETGHCSSG